MKAQPTVSISKLIESTSRFTDTNLVESVQFNSTRMDVKAVGVYIT